MQGLKSTFSGMSVNDIEAARKFYVDTLGLTVKDDSMGLLFDLPNGAEMFLYQKEDHTPASYTPFNFVVEDINAAIDDLVDKGVVFERYDNLPAPQDERGVLRGKAANQGPDIAWFKDPAGNILAVIED